MSSSCEEEDDKVVFMGATDDVELSVSSADDLVLVQDEAQYQSLQFHWTNPEYDFSNGVNTQNVFYTLEIDKAGNNFQGAKKVSLGYTDQLDKQFTVKELNTVISGLELSDYEPHDLEFRVRANLVNNYAPVYSNVLPLTVTTYLDVVYPVPAELFITGAATPEDWMSDGDADVASQKFTQPNAYTFVIENLHINGGVGFLFVPDYGNWSNKYGFTGAGLTNQVNGDFFQPGGNDFKAPETGDYKITVNFKTGKYQFEKL